MLQLGQAHGIRCRLLARPPCPICESRTTLLEHSKHCAPPPSSGAYLHPHHNWFISAAHSPEIIETSLERFAQALQTLAAGQKIRMAKWCVWAFINPCFSTLTGERPLDEFVSIHAQAPAPFANQDALLYTRALLAAHPASSSACAYRYAHTVWVELWQPRHGSEATMLHLIALQIKSMAEAQAIHSETDLLDPQYGIGSKNHKDKGCINNPLAVLGHPIQQALFNRSNPLTLHSLYHAFLRVSKIPHPFRPAAKSGMASAKPGSSCYQLLRTQYPIKTQHLKPHSQSTRSNYDLRPERSTASYFLDPLISVCHRNHHCHEPSCWHHQLP